MQSRDIDDALAGMTRRQLEALQAKLDKALVSCLICGAEGAIAVAAHAKLNGQSARFTLKLCRPCIEKQRLPETRSSISGAPIDDEGNLDDRATTG